MARIRSLRPRGGDSAFAHEWIWYDETFGDLGYGPRLTFLGMITWADGRGRTRIHPAILRSNIFPFDDLSTETVGGYLWELIDCGLVVRDEDDPAYGYLTRWRKLAKSRWVGALPEKLRLEIAERDGWICQLCGEPVEKGDLEIDHITPVAFGGTDSPTNLQASHRECNREKGASI